MTDQRLIHLVDDDDAVRHSASFMLRHAGFTVKTYTDGVAFLDVVDAAQIGCILLDVQMPRMDGLEVQEQLNARLAYNSPERDWTLAAFITNATNWMPDKVGGEPGGLGSQLATAFSDGSPSYGRTAEPRMYGVEFRYNFE